MKNPFKIFDSDTIKICVYSLIFGFVIGLLTLDRAPVYFNVERFDKQVKAVVDFLHNNKKENQVYSGRRIRGDCVSLKLCYYQRK